MSDPAKSSRAAAAAKVGVHYVLFSPHAAEPTEVSVTRVRAGTVYVRPHAGPDAGNEVGLNEVASRKLLDGVYRVKPEATADAEPEAPAPEPQPEAPAPEVKPEAQPETQAPAPEPSANGKPAKAPKPATACLCGCGGVTGGGNFIPGHDSKLKSALLQAFRAGGLSPERESLVEALGWGRFLTPAPGGKSGPSALERARAALARLSGEERAELLAEYAVPVKRL
jgi:hypothetical protein